MKRPVFLTAEQFAHLLEEFLSQTETLHDLTLSKLAVFSGTAKSTITRHLQGQHWNAVTHVWLMQRLQRAIDVVYQQAATREDFTIRAIADYAGIDDGLAATLIRNEWNARRATLPTAYEAFQKKVLAALKALVEETSQLSELTQERVLAQAGVAPDVSKNYRSWFSAAYRSASLELAQRIPQHPTEPPPEKHIRRIPGGWL